MGKKAVFVIGAGASVDAGLPTGKELKDEISKLLAIEYDEWGRKLESGDRVIASSLQYYFDSQKSPEVSVAEYIRTANHIKDAMPQAASIDNFIDSHKGNDKIAFVGKLAIARAILQAERKSHLWFEKVNLSSNINFKKINNTWYTPFFRLLTGSLTKDDLKERFKSFTLIIFNYDRCIEHFLYWALQNYYQIHENIAADLVNSIEIYHPYGDVGKLPWGQAGGGVEYGYDIKHDSLLEIAGKIKTFTEGTDPSSSEISAIHDDIRNPEKLIFLGFAFLPLNMRLLLPSLDKDKYDTDVKCYASTYGISESDTGIVLNNIRALYRNRLHPDFVKTARLKCNDFFLEFERSITF